MSHRYEYEKLNREVIPIESVLDEIDVERDFVPSFKWLGKRYYIEDFLRIHNNPWFSGSDYPDHIHAYDSNAWLHPLFIELVGDNAVNVYKEIPVGQMLTP